MTITATCGHKIIMADNMHIIRKKGYTRQGRRAVIGEVVCLKCKGKYRRWGELMDTEAEEQAWVNYEEE